VFEGAKPLKGASGALGAGAVLVCAHAIVHSSNYDPMLDEVELKATLLKNQILNNHAGAGLDGAELDVGMAMARYWSNFVPDDSYVNFMCTYGWASAMSQLPDDWRAQEV